MSKKRWYIIPVVAGLLALAVTGGAILAQGNSSGPGGTRHQGIATRVAQILGLEEATVQDAFRQAHREQRDANLQSRLDQLVANEKLTLDEAEAIRQWHRAMPVTDLPLRVCLRGSEEAVRRVLGRIVATERLTQAEADAVLEWYQEKPEALSELTYGHRRFDRSSRGHK